jgi:hypothetical protein
LGRSRCMWLIDIPQALAAYYSPKWAQYDRRWHLTNLSFITPPRHTKLVEYG